MPGSKTYKVWYDMLNRCYNKKSASYKYYGARGIWVCYRWKHSFLAFYEDMGNRPEGKTLDRIDNDASYRLSNCKWSTPQEQGQNKSNSKRLLWESKTITLSELSRCTGVSYHRLHKRIYLDGLSPYQAVSLGNKRKKGRSPGRKIINGLRVGRAKLSRYAKYPPSLLPGRK